MQFIARNFFIFFCTLAPKLINFILKRYRPLKWRMMLCHYFRLITYLFQGVLLICLPVSRILLLLLLNLLFSFSSSLLILNISCKLLILRVGFNEITKE